MRPQRADQGLLAELIEDRDDAFPQPHDSMQFDLHVLELQFRIAHRVLKEGHEIALELEILDDLEGRHLDPFVVLALRGRRHAARLAGAVLAFVNGGRKPAHQLALVVERHHHRLVGVVDAAVAGVIVNEAVAVFDADGRILHPVLDDEPDRIEAAGCEGNDAVRRDHGEIALRGVDGGHKVAPLGAGRRAHLVDHRVGLGQRRVDETADMVNLVRIEPLLRGSRLQPADRGEMS